MAETEKPKGSGETEIMGSSNPLVFISHDSRDAELAEAFGKLLKSVSAGMIKTFRSSDKKGIDRHPTWSACSPSAVSRVAHVLARIPSDARTCAQTIP